MRIFQNISIRRKQTLTIMLTSSFALLLACAAFITYDTVTFRRELSERVTILADVVGNNCAAAIDFNDTKIAEETLGALRADNNIVSACVYSRNGVVFAVYRRDVGSAFAPPVARVVGQEFTGDQLHLFRAIKSGGVLTGTIYVASDLKDLSLRLMSYVRIVGVVFLTALLAALLLSSPLQRLVSDPVLDLAQVARMVAQGKNYALRATKQSNDEIGQLVDGFNEMLSQIQQREAALQSARSDLERRVEERTKELGQSLSLLNATLESTADGILVVDGNSRVTSYNSKFIEMWRMPREQIASGEDDKILPLAMEQLKDGEAFLAKVRELYHMPEAESHDVLELKDGRIFERDSQPQRLNGECVGRVWSFRDITERKHAEDELQRKTVFLAAQVNSTIDGILVVDAQGKKTLQNQRTVDLFKIPPAIADGDDDAAQAKWVSSAVKNPERFAEKVAYLYSHPYEISRDEIELKDGTTLDRFSAPVVGKEGKYYGRIWMFRDITASKRAEAELSYERDLLRTLLDNSPDHIYFKDAQSRFIKSSKTQAAQFGMASSDELVGKTDFDFFAEAHARPAFEDEQEIIRNGRPLIGKVEKEILKNGHESWVLTTKMPYRNKDGKIIGTFGISKDITAIKEAEAKLDSVHKELLETSRLAGMAEIATNVLHNVGNVLNSVNVSASLVVDSVKKSKAANLAKVAVMLREHENDLGTFVTSDAKGRQLPAYLGQLADQLLADQQTTVHELDLLVKNIEHIKDIVTMQQSYARVSGVKEIINLRDLVEDGLRMNVGALDRHGVQVIREFENVPPINIDKHKVLQILVNLIRNAKHACQDSPRMDKRLTVHVGDGDGRIKITVNDNGIGIPPENLTRIFSHGFTTKKDGHGFGLHSGAIAAKEMGGTLTAQSDGPDKGATFTLELPLQPQKEISKS